MLQDFSMPERLHDFIQVDLLFNHLLLRVLRYPEGSGCRPGLDASEQGFEFDSVGLTHPIARLACPTGCRQGARYLSMAKVDSRPSASSGQAFRGNDGVCAFAGMTAS
jgi:hypothetical protein